MLIGPNQSVPHNIKKGISQQPLVVSYPNFKLKIRGSNQTEASNEKWNISSTTCQMFPKF